MSTRGSGNEYQGMGKKSRYNKEQNTLLSGGLIYSAWDPYFKQKGLKRVLSPLDRKMENKADKSKRLRHWEWTDCMGDLMDLESTVDHCRQTPEVRGHYQWERAAARAESATAQTTARGTWRGDTPCIPVESPRETHGRESIRFWHLKVEAIDLAYPGENWKVVFLITYMLYGRQPSAVVTTCPYAWSNIVCVCTCESVCIYIYIFGQNTLKSSLMVNNSSSWKFPTMVCQGSTRK